MECQTIKDIRVFQSEKVKCDFWNIDTPHSKVSPSRLSLMSYYCFLKALLKKDSGQFAAVKG